MKEFSQILQKLWKRLFHHNVNNSTNSKSSKNDRWSHESYCEMMKFNFRIFKELELHTLKTIKKCARVDYIMKETLKMLKLIVVFCLRNSRKDIFISILSNANDWARVIDDVFENEAMTIQKMRELNLWNKESFFSKQELEFAFSSFISRAIKIIIIVLINALSANILSTFQIISKKFIIDDQDIILESESVTNESTTDDSDITDDFDTTDDSDITDDLDTTDDLDITDDFDTIDDFDIIDDSNIIDDFDTTDDFNIIDDTDTTEDIDTTEEIETTDEINNQSVIIDTALKRRRRKEVEKSCDCREFDVALKIDLKRHDNQIHDERKILLLFSSMMYVNWEICEIHHELLRIAFNLDDNKQRWVISLKLICIWKKKWNMIDIKTRHRLWFDNWEKIIIKLRDEKSDYSCAEVLYINDYSLFLQNQSID